MSKQERSEDRAVEQERLEERAVVTVARAELMKRVLIILTAAMVATALVLMVVTLFRLGDVIFEIRETQQSGSPAVKAATRAAESAQLAAEAAQETNEQILDCLRPEGQCFQRSQRQTGDAVASINELSQYAAVCADRPGSQSLGEIRRCIADLITAAAAVQPTSP